MKTMSVVGNFSWRLARVLALAGLLVLTGAHAGDQDRDSARRRAAESDRAASAVRNATGGKVLGVQGGGQNTPPDYKVRVLLPDGRVRTMRANPQTGEVSD